MRISDWSSVVGSSDLLAVAAREQALVMVHAENNDMIAWLAHRLLQQGHTAPKFHAVAHDPLAESEATNRAIALSRLLGVPLLNVHVSGHEAMANIRNAKARGDRTRVVEGKGVAERVALGWRRDITKKKKN